MAVAKQCPQVAIFEDTGTRESNQRHPPNSPMPNDHEAKPAHNYSWKKLYQFCAGQILIMWNLKLKLHSVMRWSNSQLQSEEAVPVLFLTNFHHLESQTEMTFCDEMEQLTTTAGRSCTSFGLDKF